MTQSQSQSLLPFGPAASLRQSAVDGLLRRALPAEAGVWDEFRLPGGTVRPAWQRFCQWLQAPGGTGLPLGERDLAADFDQRVAQVAQQIRHDGVTHNVFSDAGVASRPWSLELLPLLI